MDKTNGWLFLLIALVWLLPLVGVNALGGNIGAWIATIALAIVGIRGVKGGK